jgi:hypothetical protein
MMVRCRSRKTSGKMANNGENETYLALNTRFSFGSQLAAQPLPSNRSFQRGCTIENSYLFLRFLHQNQKCFQLTQALFSLYNKKHLVF